MEFGSAASMRLTSPRHDSGRTFGGAFGWLLSAAFVVLLGCGGSEPVSMEDAEVFGSAAEGGVPEAGAVWQDVLARWPKEGNLSVLYGKPHIQGQFDAWMDGRQALSDPPETIQPVIARVQVYADPLRELDGRWGRIEDPDAVRSMAIRGMRKTLWADLRAAITSDDPERATDIMVVMCNLPRVAHAYDGSVRGLLSTIGTVDAIGWGMRDMAQAGISLDDRQVARLVAASAWLDEPAPFGRAMDEERDARRASVLAQFDASNRAAVLKARQQLLGD